MLLVLTYIQYQFMIIEVFAVTTVILSSIVLSYDLLMENKKENKADKRERAAQSKQHVRDLLRKEALRRQKEAEAHEGFFEESYIRGFDSDGSLYHLPKVIPTAKALEYYQEMDRLENTQQFNVVEELYQGLSDPKDQ